MTSQPRRRRWVAGALRAGRAAAFLTLATGINGTIAALEPRYEPIYVYLVAVVIVAWLGSLLLGVTTAIAAVILYDAMFSPVRPGLSFAAALPFVVAIGAAVMTRLARVPVERPRIAPAPPPPLLETSPPKIVEIVPAAPVIDTKELEDLRLQLAEAGRELDEARARAEKENRLRLEAAATAKARLAGLQHDLDTSRSDAIEQARRAAALHGQLDDVIRRAEDAEKKLHETAEELEVAWRKVDEEKSRADAQDQRLKELERQANDALQRAVADLAARYQEPLATAKKSLEEAFTRIPVIENERDAARLAADQANARMVALQEELLRLKEALAEARDRSGADAAALHGQLTMLRAQLEDAQTRAELERANRERLESEADKKVASIAAGLTSDYEESLGQALVDKEAARAEIRSLNQKVESLEQRLRDAQKALELERANRERIEAETDRKIASIAAGLTSDYEESLGQAMVDKEAARAEIRSLNKKVESLEQRLADAARLQTDLISLRAQLEDAQSRVEIERSNRERIEAEVDRKIASIAAGLTSDYEESLGQAMVDKEAARAEIRSLNKKIESLEQKLAQVQKEVTQERSNLALLQGELDEVRSRAEIERSEHERSLSEFDRKIASIVTGITNDHEQALGEAMVEREAARAEARALNKKVEGLQEQLRTQQAQMEAEWSEKLQTIVNHLASDHEHDIGEKIVELQTAKAEVRDLGNRIKTLQQKLDLEREQHRQNVERLIAQQKEAPKEAGGTALVLVAHSDAGMRAMSKHALEQAGYKVMTAADGLEALRACGTQRPHVVLAEAVMPKMNGRELLQLLKARPETASVKVILMSTSDVDRGSDFRADDILTTPVDFAAMKTALANVLK